MNAKHPCCCRFLVCVSIPIHQEQKDRKEGFPHPPCSFSKSALRCRDHRDDHRGCAYGWLCLGRSVFSLSDYPLSPYAHCTLHIRRRKCPHHHKELSHWAGSVNRLFPLHFLCISHCGSRSGNGDFVRSSYLLPSFLRCNRTRDPFFTNRGLIKLL